MNPQAVIVRRAAVFLLYRLVLGACQDIQGILEKQVEDVKGILLIARNDGDEIVAGHAESALQLLNKAQNPLITELS